MREIEGLTGETSVLDLSGRSELRASRNNRIFEHPVLPGVLVKVRADEPVRRHFIPRFGQQRYGNLRQWNREANEYLAALHRGCPEIDRLAGFLGFVPTSEGPGMMVEKMTGPDGDLAPTVSAELKAAVQDKLAWRQIGQEVMELIDDLERGRIIVGDLSLQNVVRARERGGRLVVIDGLGERTLFPITLLSDRAFTISIARRRKRFGRTLG